LYEVSKLWQKNKTGLGSPVIISIKKKSVFVFGNIPNNIQVFLQPA
jgi:hypothetical protein